MRTVDGFEQPSQLLTVQNEAWFDVTETAGAYFAERRVHVVSQQRTSTRMAIGMF